MQGNITCPIKHTTYKIHIAIVTETSALEIPGDDIYEVTRAERKISAFFAEHNIALNVAHHPNDFVKCQILQKVKVNRIKRRENRSI